MAPERSSSRSVIGSGDAGAGLAAQARSVAVRARMETRVYGDRCMGPPHGWSQPADSIAKTILLDAHADRRALHEQTEHALPPPAVAVVAAEAGALAGRSL